MGQQSIGPIYLLVFRLVFHFVVKSNASVVLNETLAVLEIIFRMRGQPVDHPVDLEVCK